MNCSRCGHDYDDHGYAARGTDADDCTIHGCDCAGFVLPERQIDAEGSTGDERQ